MNKVVVLTVGSAVVAVCSLTASLVTNIRYHILSKRIVKALGNVEETAEEKISERMIETAVTKSADKKVDRYMQEVDDAVLRSAKRNLEIQAKEAVEKYSQDIRDKAAEEISKQVEQLDIEKLKKRVCDQTETHIIDKFDDVLNESAKKFEDQLDNTKKIYDGITRALVEKEEKEKNGLRFVVL